MHKTKKKVNKNNISVKKKKKSFKNFIAIYMYVEENFSALKFSTWGWEKKKKTRE